MSFMIERLVGEESAVVFHVCGRVDIECLNTLKELIESESDKIVLDLSEVTLANREVATFLAECRLKGIKLNNCPAFLRSWSSIEQARMAP
jgi:anti-anti-sigma regulatory factor